jgi:hypothetical protein
LEPYAIAYAAQQLSGAESSDDCLVGQTARVVSIGESSDGSQVDQTLSDGQRDTLSTMLVKHESYRAPERLTLAPPLVELTLFLDDLVAGRRQALDVQGGAVRPADRKSMVADLQWALEDVGVSVEAAITPSLRELRAGRLSRLAEIVADGSATAELADETRAILLQLGEVDVVSAAWEDLVRAVADDSMSNQTVALRVAQLAECFELRGGEWSTSLTHALSDFAFQGHVAEAQQRLRQAPFVGAEVVWVAFGNAHLRRGFQRLGPIQFFDKRMSVTDLRDGSAELDAFDDFERAPELTDDLLERMFFKVDADAYVLARVELTGSRAPLAPLDHPVRRARQVAGTVVEAAGFLQGGSHWVLMDGGAAFGHGDYVGNLNFRDPAVVARRAREAHPTHELTGYGLTELPAAFVDAIRRQDVTALRAMTELEWHQQTSRIPSEAMRVTQRIRAFETQRVTTTGARFESWEEFVRYYMRDQWCWHEIHDALFSAVASIEHPGHPRYLTRGQDSVNKLAEAYATIMQHKEGLYGTYTWKPGAVLERAREVAGQYVSGTIERRRWRELDRIGRTGEQAAAWVTERRRTFDALLNRAVRQRNAIVHGQRTVSSVIESVDALLDQLSGGLVRRWVDAAAGGTPVEDGLELSRENLRERFDRLASEPSGFALWPAGS